MNPENAHFIKTAFAIANKVKAGVVFLFIDPLDDLSLEDEKIPHKKVHLVLVSKKKRPEHPDVPNSLAAIAKGYITLPRIAMTRMAMIKVATTLGISSDLIASGEKIVFVVGHQEIGFLDLIHVVDTAKESEVITGRGIVKIAEVVNPEIFQAVLNLVVELADKGREGKPIGTIFVVGDHEKVLQLSRQMIINPFKGYTEEERHILSPGLKETIREFAAIDGAFVIGEDGTVITAGRYLGAASDEANLPRGLGSRHIAASGITSLTKAVAFVISESSGDVRIFKDGKIVMHIEKAPSKR